MGKKIFAIYDEDISYGMRLMNYFNRKKGLPMEAQAFTNEKSMAESLENGKVEILLVSEKLSLENLNLTRADKVVFLSEGGLVKEKEEREIVYKYQSAERLIHEVLSDYLSKGDYCPVTAAGADGTAVFLISVFSPCGGCGKSSLVKEMAELLAENRSVLVINWELFPPDDLQTKGSGLDFHIEEGGFTDYIYYIRQGRANTSHKLKALVKSKGGVDYLPPASHYKDLYELGDADIEMLLDALRHHSDYEYILFDIGLFSDSVCKVLEKVDKAYLVLPEGEKAYKKALCLRRNLEQEGKEDLYKNFIPVTISSALLEEIGRGETEKREVPLLKEFVKELLK